MTNLIAPPALILVNNDLTDNVLAAVQRQLFITETIDGQEFDDRLTVDPNYIDIVHGSERRVLVVRSFVESTNREMFDIVLFIKNGLASVLVNKFGPPGQTFPVDRMYLSQLFWTQKIVPQSNTCNKCHGRHLGGCKRLYPFS